MRVYIDVAQGFGKMSNDACYYEKKVQPSPTIINPQGTDP